MSIAPPVLSPKLTHSRYDVKTNQSSNAGLIYIEHLAYAYATVYDNDSENAEQPLLKPDTCRKIPAFTADGILVWIRCGSWNCPTCSKILANLWSWRARLELEAHPDRQYFMWTLTFPAYYRSPKRCFADLPAKVKRLRQNLRAKTRQPWAYLAFVEVHPKRQGIPHLHILSDTASPMRLKDLAVYAGFGFMALEKPVKTAEAANYVAKYASKQSDAFPRNFRRVRCSQSWAKLPAYEPVQLFPQNKREKLPAFMARVSAKLLIPVNVLWGEYWRDYDARREPGEVVTSDNVVIIGA